MMNIIQVNIKNYILKKIDDEKVREFAVKMERLEFRVVKVKLKNGDIEVLATNLDKKEFIWKKMDNRNRI